MNNEKVLICPATYIFIKLVTIDWENIITREPNVSLG